MRAALLAGLGVALCVGSARAEPGWSIRRWTTEDGLPANGLTDLAQTPDGFLWIASSGGLVRFDGVEMQRAEGPLATARLNRLEVGPAGRLFAASADRELFTVDAGGVTTWPFRVNGFARRGETLWIGSDDGLWRATADGLEPLGPRAWDVVTGIHGPDGRLWVGDRAGGLSWVDGDRRVLVAGPEALGGTVYDLWFDPEGTLWVGSDHGLHRLDAGGLHPVPLVACAQPVVFNFTVVDRPWPYLSTTCGLWRLDPDGRPRSVAAAPIHPITVRPLLVTAGGVRSVHQRGGLWLDGALRVRGPVTAQLATRDDSLWAVTARGALYQLRRQVIEPLGGPEAACNAYGMHQDRDGDLWVACLDRGLLRFRGDRLVEASTDFDSARGGARSAVTRDRDGPLWFGPPLMRLDPAGAVEVTEFDTGEMRGLIIDRRGTMWVGTLDDLWRRRPGERFERVLDRRGGPIADVITGYEAPEGVLWLSSRVRGLVRFDPATDRVTVYGPAEGLPSVRIRSIRPASGGGFWLGTEDRGLLHARIDGRTVQTTAIGPDQGLPADHVHQILPDGRGRLWMSSNQGIFWAVEAELLDVVAGRRAAVDAVAYDATDGMPHREANGGFHDAGLALADGRLAFPTQSGVAVLDPRRIERDTRPPTVHIERLTADTHRWRPDETVRLAPHARDFTVTYTAPVFRHPERVRFRYRLEGFDTDWVEAGTRRAAFYTRVPPGRYRFVVTAANADGVWSPVGAGLAIEVVPLFYETRWFAALAILLALGLLAGLGRLRFARIRARAEHLEREVAARTAQLARQAEALEALDELKTRFFAHISHELRTPLTLIAGAVDRLPDTAADDVTLDALRRNTRRLRRLTDQILELQRGEAGARRVTLEPVDLGALARATVAGFAPIAERKALTAEGEATALAHPDLIETVLVNLLSNAVKFTEDGGRVAVRVSARGEMARIEVEDDGRGIPADDLPRIFDRFYRVESPTLREGEGTGLGLALVRELAHQMNGEVEVESRLGEGTRFTVRLMASDAPAVVRDYGRQGRTESAVLETPRAVDDAEDGRARVLVVDDNADLRRWVGEVLGGRYAMLYAEDGVEGLERARAELPDVVVADLMMPRLDGFGLVEALVADPETACIPVLLLTARVGVEVEVHGLRAGAVDFLTKPFDEDVLRARVDGIVARRERLRDALRAELEAGAPVPETPGTPEREAPGEAEPSVADRARAVVEARIDDEALDVDALARALGMSRATLARRLTNEQAPSPGALIREVRLDRARALLTAGRGNVSEVAFAVGFNSLAQFSRSFKAEYGVPPSRLKSAA